MGNQPLERKGLVLPREASKEQKMKAMTQHSQSKMKAVKAMPTVIEIELAESYISAP